MQSYIKIYEEKKHSDFLTQKKRKVAKGTLRFYQLFVC